MFMLSYSELSLCCTRIGKQNFRVFPALVGQLLLRMVTKTSMEMHHATIVPSKSGADVHVIVSGFAWYCECHTTISIEWQARSLGVFWVGRLFKVKWKSTQVLQCPRKSAQHIVVAVLCSWGLLMMSICHTRRCERSCLSSWKLHCCDTFPQWDSCAGPQCAPKQPVIGWIWRVKPKVYRCELLQFHHLWCSCDRDPWQEVVQNGKNITRRCTVIVKFEVQNFEGESIVWEYTGFHQNLEVNVLQ